MKKTIYLLSFACLLFVVSCKPSREEAIKYNDDIIAEQESITKKIEYLTETMDTNDSTKMDAAFFALSNQLDNSIKKIQAMKDFDGKHDFKDVAKKYFTTIREGLLPQMKIIIDISKKPVDNYTEEDQKQIDVSYKKSDEFMVEMEKIDDEFADVQEKFAKEYKFSLEESKSKKTTY